jgi:iron complex transport system permease protein
MGNSSKSIKLLLLIFIINILLFAVNLIFGSVSVPFTDVWKALFSQDGETLNTYQAIILEYRLPQTFTALLTGAALSVAGLLLQTLFRNPLAGPGILGISAGASLGVAILTLLTGAASFALSSFVINFGLVFAAFTGAFITLSLVLVFASFVKNNISLLIIGIMVGYAVSSLIGFLQFLGNQQDVHSFVLWGLGSFSQVNSEQLPFYSTVIIIGIILSLLFIKPLNALLLGENYAANLGIHVKRVRVGLIVLAGLLTAIATAYTGPIAFIGLAVPHLTRMIFHTSEHKILLPGLILNGMAIAMACNFISRLPLFDQAIPINIVTSAFGAPLVIWFLVRNNRTNLNAS